MTVKRGKEKIMMRQAAFFSAAGLLGLVLTGAPGAADGNRGNGHFGFPAFCADLVGAGCANQSDEVLSACISAQNVCANAEKTGNERLAELCNEKQDHFVESCNAASPSGAFLDD